MQAVNHHAFKSTSVIKHTNYHFLRSLKVNCGGVAFGRGGTTVEGHVLSSLFFTLWPKG